MLVTTILFDKSLIIRQQLALIGERVYCLQISQIHVLLCNQLLYMQLVDVLNFVGEGLNT